MERDFLVRSSIQIRSGGTAGTLGRQNTGMRARGRVSTCGEGVLASNFRRYSRRKGYWWTRKAITARGIVEDESLYNARVRPWWNRTVPAIMDQINQRGEREVMRGYVRERTRYGH